MRDWRRLAPACLLLGGLLVTGEGARAQAVPDDLRTARVRTNQQGANFKAPATRGEWLRRRQQLRERILVSTGLHPLPERTPLSPRIYGRVEREGYSIEKVVLETLPGFFLSGNLYRPAKAPLAGERIPGILNPHGHWQEGRIAADVQARCAGQARMGAVAFLYDMTGYVDSEAFGHRDVFLDDEARAWGMSLTGLQLWNSMRALDFLLGLPEVDPRRIACTGESGGGTQTFLLSAVDDRVQVSAPVCMISHHFQGGCLCENSPHLRVGTDNVEFGALFAPKPQMLVGATGDWTSQILEHGVPEIRAVYRLYGAEHNLLAVVHDAPHNYNQASRESVYSFLRRHLWGASPSETVKEEAFKAEDRAGLSTWSAQSPRPKEAADQARLKAQLQEVFLSQIESWRPGDARSWRTGRPVLQTALRTLLAAAEPPPGELAVEGKEPELVERYRYRRAAYRLARRAEGDLSTGTLLTPWSSVREIRPRGIAVVVHPQGAAGVVSQDGSPSELVEGLLEAGQAVLIPELFLTGKTADAAKRAASPFYATYNKTVLAERVQDVLNHVAHARTIHRRVSLIGLRMGGPVALLARPLLDDVERTAIDAAGWDWSSGLPMSDEMALPGALRYGGLRAFAALVAPEPLFLHNYLSGLDVSWVQGAYRLKNEKNLRLSASPAPPETLLGWIVQ